MGSNQARKRSTNSNFRARIISGLPRELGGATKLGMSLETWGNQTFGRDVPGFWPGYPGGCPKSLRKEKLFSIFSPYQNSFWDWKRAESPSRRQGRRRPKMLTIWCMFASPCLCSRSCIVMPEHALLLPRKNAKVTQMVTFLGLWFGKRKPRKSTLTTKDLLTLSQPWMGEIVR